MEQNVHSDYSDKGRKRRGRRKGGKRQADSRHYKQNYINFDPLEAVKAINATPPSLCIGEKAEKKQKNGLKSSVTVLNIPV